MVRLARVILLLSACLFLIGCAQAPSSRLVGTWRVSDGQVTSVWAFDDTGHVRIDPAPPIGGDEPLGYEAGKVRLVITGAKADTYDGGVDWNGRDMFAYQYKVTSGGRERGELITLLFKRVD